MAYTPQRGDIVRISFHPQAGHEQAGRRPALTLSTVEYNAKVGLALFCPITSKVKGYPFEVEIPDMDHQLASYGSVRPKRYRGQRPLR